MNLFDDSPRLTSHQFKIKGGKIWHLTEDYYNELKETFPLKDVEGCMREAKQWCKITVKNRKTAKGMKKFLYGWVSRSEETGFVTTDPEKSEKDKIREKNVNDYIYTFQNIINTWPVESLLKHRQFRHACKAFPEVKKWAIEQRPELKS